MGYADGIPLMENVPKYKGRSGAWHSEGASQTDGEGIIDTMKILGKYEVPKEALKLCESTAYRNQVRKAAVQSCFFTGIDQK